MHSVDPSSRSTVLVVCFGNLCRSPMAEGLFRAVLPRDQWRVASAGTHAIGGDSPTRGARDALRRIAGLDISHQRSKPLTVDLLREADHVFTMSRRQALEAAALLPQVAPRVRLLGAFAPAHESADLPADPHGDDADAMEIPDPMGESADTYEACCRRIDDCVRAAAQWLAEGADPGAAPASVATWLERA